MSKKKLIGKSIRGPRGFDKVVFKDIYGEECSLQESSKCIIQEDDGTVADPKGYVWLGIEDANPRIMKRDAVALGVYTPAPGEEITGWVDFPVPREVMLNTRMHLDEHKARALIARLEFWLRTGRIVTRKEAKDAE